jgi:hypothetical protein
MRRIAAPVIVASALALGAGLLAGAPASAVVPPAAEPATAAVSADAAPVAASVAPVPRVDYAGLAKAAVGAANAIYKCDAFTKDGLKCEAKPTIKDVVTKLNAIEAQIAQNQAQTMRALDSLQSAIDAQDLTKALKDLAPVRAHIFEAGKAWDAMSTCADKAVNVGATCTGYAGVALPGVPVADGLSESKEFFLGQMDKITLTIEQATEYFAGIEGQPSVGLLHNLWKVAKRQQDRDSGASSPGQLPLQPVLITRQLATTFLPVMTYYRDMMFLYGALRPAAKELKGKSPQARSEAALADSKVYARTDRWTVAGAFDYYRIPDVPPGTFAYVGGDGKLYKIVPDPMQVTDPKQAKGIPLNATVLMEIGDRISRYGYNADVMAKNPSLLPHSGRFGVWEKVKHRTYKEYSYGKYAICAGVGGFGCPGSSNPGTRTQTFEIGHPDAVGTKDKYGNLMKMRWAPMQILSVPATWGRLLNREIGGYGCGSVASLKGEPPFGVWNVQFLETFRRTVENRHAMFEWDYVNYGDGPYRCVGPGVYLTESRGEPFSIVDKGRPPGILVK